MIFSNLQGWIGRHFVFEGVFVFALVSEENVFAWIQDTVFNVLFTESSEEFSIQIVSNSTSVKYLTDHVFKYSSVDLLHLSLLLRSSDSQVIEIFFNEA